eukprot:2586110-Amphidinium_carterae.1
MTTSHHDGSMACYQVTVASALGAMKSLAQMLRRVPMRMSLAQTSALSANDACATPHTPQATGKGVHNKHTSVTLHSHPQLVRFLLFWGLALVERSRSVHDQQGRPLARWLSCAVARVRQSHPTHQLPEAQR